MSTPQLNAYARALDTDIVRGALAAVLNKHRMLPAKAVMHQAQRCSWEMCVGTRDLATIGGIPIVEDIRELPDRIALKDADDNLLFEIVCLAIPGAFFEGA